MKIRQMIEVLCAMHLSSRVEGPFPSRGGIMLVGSPGVFKTSLLAVLDANYDDALMLSDVNVSTLTDYRSGMQSGRIRSIVLPELAKLYERNPATANNVIGTVRALVDEGFRSASFEDARIQRASSRCTVMGALTPALQQKHYKEWIDSGFARRFLWLLISLADEDALTDAVTKWQRIDFHAPILPRPPIDSSRIPLLSSDVERRHLLRFLKHQPGESTVVQHSTLVKIHGVLKWWYQQTGDKRDAMDTVTAFGISLGSNGAQLELELPAEPQKRRRKSRKRKVRRGQR